MPLYVTQKTLLLIVGVHLGLKVEINEILKVCKVIC